MVVINHTFVCERSLLSFLCVLALLKWLPSRNRMPSLYLSLVWVFFSMHDYSISYEIYIYISGGSII